MTITVNELAKKLVRYVATHGDTKVFLAHDGEVAFPVGKGDDHTVFGPNGMEKFLVLYPDQRGDRIKL